ncbi:MAG: DUF1425 domain-containing protein [Methylococcaceae bacterium]|nr:DUF1425 domain-containing protein [Methylococcaceae bacterium]
MIRKKIFFVLICLLSASCSTNQGANVKYLAQKTIDDTHPRATLILGSTELVNKVLITNVRVAQVGLLQKAGIDVQNLTDNRYNLEYKIVWRDKQGFPIKVSNVWHRFVLSPRKIKSFQSMGKTEQAYSVQFTVRFPDDLFIDSDKHEVESKQMVPCPPPLPPICPRSMRDRVKIK